MWRFTVAAASNRLGGQPLTLVKTQSPAGLQRECWVVGETLSKQGPRGKPQSPLPSGLETCTWRLLGSPAPPALAARAAGRCFAATLWTRGTRAPLQDIGGRWGCVALGSSGLQGEAEDFP